MVIIVMHTLLALLEPFVLIQELHSDIGDERGIRLRCIALGDAPGGGRRPSGITDVGQGSVWQRLGISDCQILSLERSF